MKGKITEEIRNKMVECRKEGMTYSEIMKKFNVSKWVCINYLRSIPINRSYIEKKWRLAEEEAEKILLKNGFSNILNLNNICPSPYWDYYAEKNNKRWLIDVTINEKKSIIEKYSRTLDNFICAILYKNENGKWNLIKINSEVIKLNNQINPSKIDSIKND